MCGILAIFGAKGDIVAWRQLAVQLSRRHRHRGPDGTGLIVVNNPDGSFNILVHERLAIVDPAEVGRQPFVHQDNPDLIYLVNGEIYSYEALVKEHKKEYYKSHSDSQAVGISYSAYGMDCFHKLEGMWATIIMDKKANKWIAARDHVGIIPLYAGKNHDGVVFISSEIKCIHDQCPAGLSDVLPGRYVSNGIEQVQWYKPTWHNLDHIPTKPYDPLELRKEFTEAVRQSLICDVPFGLLTSGGVDSSLVASIAMRLVRDKVVTTKDKGMQEVHSFSVGLEGSPDVLAARKVAAAIGTKHHEIIYTVEEGLDAIPEVIYHLESYNPATVRCAIPMYFMARKIKSLGIKMVLTGEGADEIFGGYLYFHKAPSKEELHKELIRKINYLGRYDLMYSNKAPMAWGVEVRPPFMNKGLIEYVMGIDPAAKWVKSTPKPIEKYALRAAFDDPKDPYLPPEILWRQKEQFCDGVGYTWVDGIKDYAEKLIPTADWNNRAAIYPTNTPTSKEMFLFRKIFETYFPSKEAVLTVPFNLSIACSTEAALEWDESFKNNCDESGRAILGIHNQASKMADTQL